ncbi:MAG: universal stress protein [Gammaproteobacteria bacterium]|nr:MAG: universal stress protein [Gammaproteobacteria bacterium]
MPIKTILLPLGEKDRDDALLDAALAAAKRFNAHLDVVHVEPDAESLLPYATIGLSESMRASVRDAASQQRSQATKALQEIVDRACVRNGVSMARRGEHLGKVSADWLVETGSQTEIVAQLGRLADLIIVPRPVRISPPPKTIDAALRETGRPVLMLPPRVFDSIGDRVVIGWNGSKEAAQAVTAARPVLREASAVTVLTTDKRQKRRPNSDDLLTYLSCHAIVATMSIMDTRTRSVPEALLANARELNADLLVTGGYSRHRLREVIMGGVTRYLLAESDIPMLMVH